MLAHESETPLEDVLVAGYLPMTLELYRTPADCSLRRRSPVGHLNRDSKAWSPSAVAEIDSEKFGRKTTRLFEVGNVVSGGVYSTICRIGFQYNRSPNMYRSVKERILGLISVIFPKKRPRLCPCSRSLA